MTKELEQARNKTSSNQKQEKKLINENKDLNKKLDEASQERANLQKKLSDLMEYNSQAKNLEAQEIKLKKQ